MQEDVQKAYDNMMSNLAKSTAQVPLHLQGAKVALAWWENADSLLAKSVIDPSGSPTVDAASPDIIPEEPVVDTPADELAKSMVALDALTAPLAQAPVDALGELEKAISSLEKADFEPSHPIGHPLIPAKKSVKKSKKDVEPETSVEWIKRMKGLDKDSEISKSLQSLDSLADELVK